MEFYDDIPRFFAWNKKRWTHKSTCSYYDLYCEVMKYQSQFYLILCCASSWNFSKCLDTESPILFFNFIEEEPKNVSNGGFFFQIIERHNLNFQYSQLYSLSLTYDTNNSILWIRNHLLIILIDLHVSFQHNQRKVESHDLGGQLISPFLKIIRTCNFCINKSVVSSEKWDVAPFCGKQISSWSIFKYSGYKIRLPSNNFQWNNVNLNECFIVYEAILINVIGHTF